jgi:uncharacterized protein YecE (DUF72 family)
MAREVTAGQIRIGISGWQYAGWRGDFYPRGLAHRSELSYVADRLATLELNGPFYSLQHPRSYQRWHDQTPEGFVFALKGGRYITHLKRLRGVETALANFFASGVLRLGEKLGPVLWQLPERVEFDPGVLRDFLTLLPPSTTAITEMTRGHDAKIASPDFDPPTPAHPVRHAMEVRNHTFENREFFDLLREHDIACVTADSAGRWPQLEATTASFEYIRLHGHTELYSSQYATRTLERWAERCRTAEAAGRDVYVYFDNDARGHAPYDAARLTEMLGLQIGTRPVE